MCRRFVEELSMRILGPSPRAVRVGFLVDKEAMGYVLITSVFT